MPVWSQLGLQERIRPNIIVLRNFHDYRLGIICAILFFVGGISYSVVRNAIISFFNPPILTELIWTVLPIIVLLGLALPSLRLLYDIEDNDPFTTLKVLGHQWYWNYSYPHIEFDSYIMKNNNTNRLLDVDHRVVIPFLKEVRVIISAADVLHCWTVPSFGIKVDAIPGRLNQCNFKILRSGVSFGQCSEICGANHSFIPISVEVVRPDKYTDWLSLCEGKKYSCKLYIGTYFPLRVLEHELQIYKSLINLDL